jgi:hypothetical protein
MDLLQQAALRAQQPRNAGAAAGTSRAALSALLDAGPSVHVSNHNFLLLLRQCESCNIFRVLTWMRGYF